MKLDDSTPVILRTKKDLSSATVKVGDRVPFRVAKDVRVADLIAIPKGADAWGVVTAVQGKRRKGQPGKLDIAIQSVQLLTGESAPLRAEQHAEGKSQFVGTAADIPRAAIETFGIGIPIVLFSMLEKGKDAYWPAGTKFTAYLNGDVVLDRSALTRVQPAPVRLTGPGTVTIFRVETGLRFQLPVYCGEIALAKLPHSSFMQIQLPPGKYSFRSSDKQVVEVRLEEGQELYLQMQLVIVRGFKGHLVQVDNADGEEKVANLNELPDKEVRKVSRADLAEVKAAPEVKSVSAPAPAQRTTKPSVSRETGTAEKGPPSDLGPATKPSGEHEMTKIALGYNTQGIAFTEGAIWVAYSREKNKKSGVFRMDPNTNQPVAVVDTGKLAGGVAAGEGAVWISNFGENFVTRIDPETNRIVATVTVGKYPWGLDVGEGSVWVTNAGSNTVSRIDPNANAVISTVAVGKRPGGIAVAGGFVWVANSKSKSVSRIDPKTNALVATIEVEGEPETVTARGNDVWASCQLSSGLSVQRIDAKTNSIVAKTTIGTKALVGGTALLDGVLWVADRAGGALWKIDIHTNTTIGEPVPAGLGAMIMGVGTDRNGAIWLSNPDDGTVRKIKP